MLVAGYVVHALRTRQVPLIDVRLFARRGFATATSFLVGASLYSSMLLIPLYYQHVTGVGVLAAGLLLAPQALGAAAGSLVAGRLTDRRGPRPVVLAGICLTLLGTLGFTQVQAGIPGWLLSISLLVRGIGLAAVMGPNLAAVYTMVPSHLTSRAATAVNILNRVGGAIGVGTLMIILQVRIGDHHYQM